MSVAQLEERERELKKLLIEAREKEFKEKMEKQIVQKKKKGGGGGYTSSDSEGAGSVSNSQTSVTSVASDVSEAMLVSPGRHLKLIAKADLAGTGNYIGFYLTKEIRWSSSKKAIRQRQERHEDLWEEIADGTITVWKKHWIFERGFTKMLVAQQVASKSSGASITRNKWRTADTKMTTTEAIEQFNKLPRYVYKYGSVYDQELKKRQRSYIGAKSDAVTIPTMASRGFGAVWTLEIRAWQNHGPNGWVYQDLGKMSKLKDDLSKVYEFGIHDYFHNNYQCMLLNNNYTRDKTEEYIFGLPWNKCIEVIEEWNAISLVGDRWPPGTGNGKGGPAPVLDPKYINENKGFWFQNHNFYGGNIAFCAKLVKDKSVVFTDKKSVDSFAEANPNSSDSSSESDLLQINKLRF